MTAILVAYIVVSIVCIFWMCVRDWSFPDEMEDLYTVVGFGFLWPVSIGWELYCEWKHQHPIGYDDLSNEVSGSVTQTCCPHCGDVRVIFCEYKSFTRGYLSPRWWTFVRGEPEEIVSCPYCNKELPIA